MLGPDLEIPEVGGGAAPGSVQRAGRSDLWSLQEIMETNSWLFSLAVL